MRSPLERPAGVVQQVEHAAVTAAGDHRHPLIFKIGVQDVFRHPLLTGYAWKLTSAKPGNSTSGRSTGTVTTSPVCPLVLEVGETRPDEKPSGT